MRNHRVKQVLCLMPKTCTNRLTQDQKYFTVRVSRVPAMFNYENVLAITSLQPGVTDWVTAVSRIPLHPAHVAERHGMRIQHKQLLRQVSHCIA